ncbi:MAG: LysE family transporter [Candidatus Methanodesulfokora sp.]
MDLLSFILEVEVITASGALSPGPLTVSAASLGLKNGRKAGFLISLGHMAVEFPLVLLIAAGISVAAQNFRSILSLMGGIFLIYFSFIQLKSLKKTGIYISEDRGNALIAGIMLTALNPYFIVWWLTVGTKLVIDSMYLFPLGVLLMYILHIWMDFAWLIFIAYIFYKGGRLNEFALKVILGVLSFVLIFFGAEFIYNAFR